MGISEVETIVAPRLLNILAYLAHHLDGVQRLTEHCSEHFPVGLKISVRFLALPPTFNDDEEKHANGLLKVRACLRDCETWGTEAGGLKRKWRRGFRVVGTGDRGWDYCLF